MEKNSSLDVKGYYKSLSRSERGRFLKYLFVRYEYNPRTMSMKLNGTSNVAKLRLDERENIESVITSGVWKQ
jgi:hypothetical protein